MSNTIKTLAEHLSAEGHFFDVGDNRAFLILPEKRASSEPVPWIWYAPTFMANHPNLSHAWMLEQFLEKGIGLAGVEIGESFGNPKGRSVFTAFYEMLVDERGMSTRPCLLPQSRGGLMLYNWAVEHPLCVSCIAGIFTVCDLRSYPGLDKACAAYGMSEDELAGCLGEHNPVDRLGPLAEAHVPIFHVHGDSDVVVPLEENSGAVLERYRQLGGDMRLKVIPGKGHEVISEFFECPELVEFVIQHTGGN